MSWEELAAVYRSQDVEIVGCTADQLEEVYHSQKLAPPEEYLLYLKQFGRSRLPEYPSGARLGPNYPDILELPSAVEEERTVLSHFEFAVCSMWQPCECDIHCPDRGNLFACYSRQPKRPWEQSGFCESRDESRPDRFEVSGYPLIKKEFKIASLPEVIRFLLKDGEL